MILGTYSIPHIISMYQNPDQRTKLNQYIWLMVMSVILWITAFGMLVYYWNQLELWAQVLGVIGLFFNSVGSLFTIFVVYFGTIQESTEYSFDMNPLPKSVSEKKLSPILVSETPFIPKFIPETTPFVPTFNGNEIPL